MTDAVLDFETFDEEPIRKREFLGYNLASYNPFGFIYIKGKGPVPKDLQGSFTSFMDAERAVEAYVNKKNK